MTKAEIVAKVAEEIKISKTAAGKALALITDSIAGAIRKGEKVALVGFGTFSVVQREGKEREKPAERQGDQDRREEGAQVHRRVSAQGSGRGKSPCQETQG